MCEVSDYAALIVFMNTTGFVAQVTVYGAIHLQVSNKKNAVSWAKACAAQR